MRQGQAIAEGMALAKDLGNLGGNVCTPAYLADTARALGKEFKLKVEVLERADMEKLGMGSALSVGRASHEPCKFIVMHYRGGGAKAKPIVLVGKGITFDTGGISLKPGDDLDMMKYDMAGGAQRARHHEDGRAPRRCRSTSSASSPRSRTCPAATPAGRATSSPRCPGRPSRSSNTDAEGRLVLCDALTYAERFEPACVVDVATLTGACIIALGDADQRASSPTTTRSPTSCSRAASRRGRSRLAAAAVGRVPDPAQEQLRRHEQPGRAAPPARSRRRCFLARFAGAYKWAHLDIAGTASVSGDAKGATGRPVPLLTEFLLGRADDAAD